MTLGYDRDHAIKEKVSKQRKHFTARFECSVNAKPFKVIKKVLPGLSREFQKYHEKDKKVRGMKVNLLMTGMYTLINFSDYTEKLHEVRDALEKASSPIEGFTYRYEKAAEGKKDEWIFEVSFYDVDPTDPITGTGYWEIYR